MSQEVDSKILERLDRQTRTLGLGTTIALSKAKVLVIGMGGLGAEVSKGIVLMGVGQVDLYDEKDADWLDLATQFFLRESSIGKNRVSQSIEELRTLNPFCKINSRNGEDLEKIIPDYNVVVFCEESLPKLVKYNDLCRKNNIKFIAAETHGVFGNVFCDFGDEFQCNDPTGEKPLRGLVVDMTVDDDGIGHIDFHEEDNEFVVHLRTGDQVKITHVKGMDKLNGQIRTVSRTEMWKFSIGKVDDLGKYEGGGYWEEVIKGTTLKYSSLADYLSKPTLPHDYDTTKNETYRRQAFLALEALWKFEEKNNRMPQPYNAEDVSSMVTIAQELGKNQSVEVNQELVENLAKTAQGNVNPVVCFIGGMVGQEVQKGISGKFGPVNQDFVFEACEVLPENLKAVQLENQRYDGMIACFGNELQEKLLKSKIFMIGAGALGCEFMKNFAAIGACCSKKGKFTVTDNDSIETSNLSRQFLFREEHVGEMKSESAKDTILKYNPDFNCDAHLNYVGPESEDIYNEQFWNGLDIIVTALDNVKARTYCDQMAIKFRKPMIDSGTTGTRAHTLIVDPVSKTTTYGSKTDTETQEFAACTVHVHPNRIEHCIVWAKSLFVGEFANNASLANKYLMKPDEMLKTGLSETELEILCEAILSRPKTWKDCLTFALDKNYTLFNYKIKDILSKYPPDMEEDGKPFWTGSKRCPKPGSFDLSDEMHAMFIESMSRLIAEVYSIKVDENLTIQDVLKDYQPPKYVVGQVKDDKKKKKSAELTEEEEEKRAAEIAKKRLAYAKSLEEKLSKSLDSYKNMEKLVSIDFEKDDPTNFHVEFMTACSNLRARAFTIPEVTKDMAKGIAGNIIPAMITTTASTTGLVVLEYLKFIQQKPLEAFKATNFNIGIPQLTRWTPSQAPKKLVNNRYTLWDRFIVDEGKDITLKEVLDKVNKEVGPDCQILGLSYHTMIWPGQNLKYKEQREKAPLAKLIEALTEEKIPKYVNQLVFHPILMDKTTKEAFHKCPPIYYRWKKQLTDKENKKLALKKKLAARKKKQQSSS